MKNINEFKIKATTRIELEYIDKNELELEYQKTVTACAEWAERDRAEAQEQESARKRVVWEKEQASSDRRAKWFDLKYRFKQWFWDKFEFPIMIAFFMIVPGLVVGLPIAAIVLLLMHLGG